MDKRVFLDSYNRPFMVMDWGKDGDPWLFYWHKDNHWVSLRPLKPDELKLIPDNVPQVFQDFYHLAHAKWAAQYEPAYFGSRANKRADDCGRD